MFNTIGHHAMAVLEGLSLGETRLKLDMAFWPTLYLNWAVWPAVQLVNFRYVSPHLRVSFISLVALGWQTFLSWENNKALQEC